MFFIFHWARIWFPVVLYALLFSAVSTLLRGSMITGGLRSALCVTFYASIPPLIVATVYTGLDIPFLDFQRVFVVAFFVYLLICLSVYSFSCSTITPALSSRSSPSVMRYLFS